MYNHWKNCPPMDTVENINRILSNYNIVLNSTFTELNPLGVFSTRVHMVNQFPNFSVSGKGATPEYALASGQAEFMERLQTFMILHRGIFDYKVFSDEQINLEDHYSYCPYLNLITGETAMHLADPRHSTGMASGNTDAEALVHAICEVIERQCSLDLVNDLLPVNARLPQSVCPIDLTELERRIGGKVQLFDVGRFGIPTVALICRNEESRVMVFHLDTAPTLTLAAERCVTEIFQNNPFGELRSCFWQGDLEEVCCPATNIQYGMLVDYHHGALPGFLVERIELAAAPYETPDYSHLQTEADVIQQFLTVAKDIFPQGVFVRDYKWAGFPTVFVCVPDLLEQEMPSQEMYMHIYKYNIDEYLGYKGTDKPKLEQLIRHLNEMFFKRPDPLYHEYRKNYAPKDKMTIKLLENEQKLRECLLATASKFSMNMEDFTQFCLSTN